MKNIEDVRKEVSEYSDATGRKVEPGIFDLVVALKMLNFQTTSSCEGHLEEKIFFTPHVQFCGESYDIERTYENMDENVDKLNEMVEYLNEFYLQNPEIEHQYRYFCQVLPGMVSQLQTLDRHTVKIDRNWEEKEKVHAIHQAQLKKITDFIIGKVKSGS